MKSVGQSITLEVGTGEQTGKQKGRQEDGDVCSAAGAAGVCNARGGGFRTTKIHDNGCVVFTVAYVT